jgi:DNA-binding MarR family transcriptional regulator
VRAAEPTDQRATLVTFTPLGWQFLRDAHEIKRKMEAEYAAVLGDKELQALKDALITLLQASF